MNVGELFFSLGFKSEGLGEAKQFENVISASNDVTQVLMQSMEKLGDILGKMAVKMGAMTDSELIEIKSKERLNKGINDLNFGEKKGNIEKTKSQGILKSLNVKMKEYWGNLAMARLQILGSTTALTYFVKKASDAAVHLDKLSTLTGLSTDTLQRMGDMAAQTGSSVDDIAGAVRNFQQQSVDIMLGRGGNIGAFQFFGLDPHEDPLKLLDQLAAKLKTMPTALGNSMARDLGLSDDLIYFLKNKQNVMPPETKTLLTDKEIKRLKDFNFYFTRIFEQSKRVMQKFAAFLTPIATLIINFFDRMGTTFSGLSTKLEPFFESLKKYLPWIVAIGGALFVAFFPLTGALLLLAAAIDDIWAFVRGEDSLLGRMLSYFTDINGAVKDLIHYYIQLRKLMTLGNYDEYWDKQEELMTQGYAEYKAEKDKEKKEGKEKKPAGLGAAEDQMGKMNWGIGGKINEMWDNSSIKATLRNVGLVNPEATKKNTVTNNVNINVNGVKDPNAAAIKAKDLFDNAVQSSYFEKAAGEK
jgi:hypothetical protein